MVLMLCAASARAETLGESDIRVMYDDAVAAVDDPEKTQTIMNDRLDNSFSLKLNVTRIIGNNAPQNSEQVMDKLQTISDAMGGYRIMTKDKYNNNIKDIRFSDDGKLAYVNDETSTTGTLNLSGEDGSTGTAHYAENSLCVDTLSLVKDRIHFMRSDCDDQITVSQ